MALAVPPTRAPGTRLRAADWNADQVALAEGIATHAHGQDAPRLGYEVIQPDAAITIRAVDAERWTVGDQTIDAAPAREAAATALREALGGRLAVAGGEIQGDLAVDGALEVDGDLSVGGRLLLGGAPLGETTAAWGACALHAEQGSATVSVRWNDSPTAGDGLVLLSLDLDPKQACVILPRATARARSIRRDGGEPTWAIFAFFLRVGDAIAPLDLGGRTEVRHVSQFFQAHASFWAKEPEARSWLWGWSAEKSDGADRSPMDVSATLDDVFLCDASKLKLELRAWIYNCTLSDATLDALLLPLAEGA